jgi:hypothetical protein
LQFELSKFEISIGMSWGWGRWSEIVKSGVRSGFSKSTQSLKHNSDYVIPVITHRIPFTFPPVSVIGVETRLGASQRQGDASLHIIG